MGLGEGDLPPGPGWLAIHNRPDPPERRHAQSQLSRGSKGPKSFLSLPRESNRRLWVSMAFSALTAFKGFYPSIKQDMNLTLDALV